MLCLLSHLPPCLLLTPELVPFLSPVPLGLSVLGSSIEMEPDRQGFGVGLLSACFPYHPHHGT